MNIYLRTMTFLSFIASAYAINEQNPTDIVAEEKKSIPGATYEEKETKRKNELVSRTVGTAETVKRNNIVKEEMAELQEIQKLMKQSFENAQKREKERYQNEMMDIQNEFAEPKSIAVIYGGSVFMHDIDVKKLPFIFTDDSIYNTRATFERAENLHEQDGKVYAAYRRIK